MIFDTCLSTYFLTYWKTIAFTRGTEDSHLKSLVKTTFALLLDDVNTGDNRDEVNLVQKLDERVELLRRRNGINNKLLTSLNHLKSAMYIYVLALKNLMIGDGLLQRMQPAKTSFWRQKTRAWKLAILAQKPNVRILKMTRKVSCIHQNIQNCGRKSFKTYQATNL